MMKKNLKRFPVYKNHKGKQNHWVTMLGCESNEWDTWDPIAQSLRVVLHCYGYKPVGSQLVLGSRSYHVVSSI